MIVGPLESVVPLAASFMPACTSTSVTESPAEGLLVVLLVTVPVMEAACAVPHSATSQGKYEK